MAGWRNGPLTGWKGRATDSCIDRPGAWLTLHPQPEAPRWRAVPREPAGGVSGGAAGLTLLRGMFSAVTMYTVWLPATPLVLAGVDLPAGMGLP